MKRVPLKNSRCIGPKSKVFNIDQFIIGYFKLNDMMHQEGFISVFSDILYDDHSPSVGPRGSILPLGVVMIIVGRALSKTLFFHGLVG